MHQIIWYNGRKHPIDTRFGYGVTMRDFRGPKKLLLAGWSGKVYLGWNEFKQIVTGQTAFKHYVQQFKNKGNERVSSKDNNLGHMRGIKTATLYFWKSLGGHSFQCGGWCSLLIQGDVLCCVPEK